MTARRVTGALGMAALLALAGCGDMAAPDVTRAAETPAVNSQCLAREPVPAVYEQVMGEVQVVQAEIAEDGTVIRPPIYRRAPVPQVVRPRSELTFATPCPETQTPEFLASLQRALAARGLYGGPVTGAMDAATQAAVRRYQAARGLDSAQLSLETARALGLVAVEIPPNDA